MAIEKDVKFTAEYADCERCDDPERQDQEQLNMTKYSPYAPPVECEYEAKPSLDKQSLTPLLGLARAYRSVNMMIVGFLCMVPVNLFLSIAAETRPAVGDALSIVLVCMCLIGAISVYDLVSHLRERLVAIVHVLAFFIPIAGLLLLAIAMRQASAKLKESGLKVGILGANASSVAQLSVG